MLTYAAFILPALAIGTILWLLSRPLPLIIGSLELGQRYEVDPQLVREMAHQRDQGDEYETLVEMEFQPLGVYYEQFDSLPECFAEFVFEHRSLPVFVALCQNHDQQRFVAMVTEGQGRKYLRTSSSSSGPEVRESELRMINVKADFVEDVLKAHMQELSAWGEEGFVAANGSGLEGFSRLCRGQIAHPFFTNRFRRNGLSMMWRYFTLLTFTPLIVGIPMAYFLSEVFRVDLLQFVPVLQCVSVWVLLFGGYIHWSTKNAVTNEESNSLKKSTALRDSKAIDVDSFRTQDGKGFDLPFRDTSIVQQQALEWLMGTSVVLMGVCGMAVAAILNPNLRTSLFLYFLLFVPVVVGGFMIPRLLFAWQALTNRTKHQLQIDNSSIISREKRLICDYKRKCKIKEVATIRVEHLRKCPAVMHTLSQVCDDEWGILIFKGRLGENLLFAAPAYRVDVLVSLASEIAADIGLDPDSVVVAKEFMNAADIEQQEEKEETSIKEFLSEGVLH